MLSALIRTERCYPAVPLGGTTGSQEVRPTRSSRTSVGPDLLKSQRPQQIETELSHDVLNPARVPMGEQPNPWDLLQPQDVTSRHRGAKPLRRYELLGGISLLSPEYLLSFERRPFHAEPPDHYAQVPSCATCLSLSQAPLCHYTLRPVTNRLRDL